MRKSEREAVIAHHEAGHAVIARVLGMGIGCVTLFSTDSNNEAVALTISASSAARGADQATLIAALEKDAMVSLAGSYAQVRYRPAKNQDGWESDTEAASSFVALAVALRHGMTPEDGRTLPKALAPECLQLYERLCDKTEALVAEHWSSIVRVAKALPEHPALNEADVDDLIAGRFLKAAKKV